VSSRQHSPLVILEGESSRVLHPLPVSSNQALSGYNEAWLRDLIFANPVSIPIQEIEPSYGPLIPVCKELNTRSAGPADALFINPLGMPTLMECKLWRNPEARREVIGQILDYAAALRDWTHSDLQREAARARKERGFNLADWVRTTSALDHFDESAFCDNVSRNLQRSRILLLIVGDGIREGVEGIADYVRSSPALHFTLGLIEMLIFQASPETRIVQSRVLARTAIINRTVIDLASPALTIVDEGNPEKYTDSPAIPQRDEYMLKFWADLLSDLKLDEAEQPPAKPLGRSNIYFPMPTRRMWLTCYFFQKDNEIGVFLGSDRTSPLALTIGRRLEDERAQIDAEFAESNLTVSWTKTGGGKTEIGVSKHYLKLRDPSIRENQLTWFKNAINTFVNVLRPRISRLVEAMETPLSAG
jgi:hypothetical protein